MTQPAARLARCAALALALGLALVAAGRAGAAPACPPGDRPFARFHLSTALFDAAIEKAGPVAPHPTRLTGLTVPHHMLAGHLIARGVAAAGAGRYRRIVLLAPDHFFAADAPFATTARDFDTVYGRVATDGAAARALLTAGGGLVEESCLFAREHGVRAILPFLKRQFPDARVLPVAIAIGARRDAWDRLAEALAPLVDGDTLVVQSSDFSHYHPQHAARRFDQQTLNLIAAGDLEQIAGLSQPDHVDSLGALYLQTRLQRERHGAVPLVLASENAQQYADHHVAETTSYMVVAYAPQHGSPPPPGDAVARYYLAGDTLFGRAMVAALLPEANAERVAAAVLAATGGAPLVVNLEGVVLPNVPEGLDHMTLAMNAELTVAWLKRLNVAAVGLANNHAMDLGAAGYRETRAALAAAGLAAFGPGERVDLPHLSVAGFTDLSSTGPQKVDLLAAADFDVLAAAPADRPLVAFIHWGREYVAVPGPRERLLADRLRLAGAGAIVGAHPHVASDGPVALAGGETLLHHSLGNFLFDQTAETSSGALIEIRVFAQGTFFARRVDLPVLFDRAAGRAQQAPRPGSR
ncbi:AmmeMemoRadiSam system protein B [Aquibium sp. A9E412]|uniref:AmmeMemoRadiSam system protein B n=1 Tax=Aquibium sp. A9E412 TaxID=2976767 RepID=UPI0025AFCF35|nr:AmmeMemoRadiSam system protein B [Aquibium sp. A9E412]MDN2565924.1 AmmeMemoRadiSam system protein B [Aquibium sp. A9E412]